MGERSKEKKITIKLKQESQEQFYFILFSGGRLRA